MNLPLIKTSCEDCVFAVFENRQGEECQVGCQLGRLVKFEERGTYLEPRKADNGKVAFAIGRACMAARKGDWGHGLTDEEKVQKVREELKVAVHVYVPAIGASPEAIEKTLDSLVVQDPKPAAAEVIVHGRWRPGALIRRLQERYDDKLNWKLCVVNDDYTDAFQAIDKAVPSCRSPFYAVYHAGSEAPASFLTSLNRFVNDELMTFGVIKGDDLGNGDVVVREMHECLGGNATVDMVEGNPDTMTDEELEKAVTVPVTGIVNKVIFLSEKVGLPNLIQNYQEFKPACPSL
jgi:hypothetical protein